MKKCPWCDDTEKVIVLKEKEFEYWDGRTCPSCYGKIELVEE